MDLETYRAMGDRDLLAQLRFLETLEALPLAEAEALVAAIDLDRDAGWLGPVLARRLPATWWSAHLGAPFDFDREAIESAVRQAMGARWIELLVDLLDGGAAPGAVLGRLDAALSDAPALAPRLERAWTGILALCTHEDPRVRGAAALLSARGDRVTPAVVGALEKSLASAMRADPDSYDEQVSVEDLLTVIARAGEALAALAPHVAPLLATSFRPFAAQAAGALGDRRLLQPLLDVEQVEARDAMVRFALWQLTGERAWLERALDDAAASVIVQLRLQRAFEAMPPSEACVAGLALAASRPAWRRGACEALAEVGRPAAAAVAAIAVTDPEDDAHTAVAVHHARWRAGLVDDAGLARELQPLLAVSFRAWGPFVALDLGTDAWRSEIRAAIAAERTEALAALVEMPAIGARFLPDLVAAGREGAVFALWRDLPRERFWAPVAS